jgi:hypothetical protein
MPRRAPCSDRPCAESSAGARSCRGCIRLSSPSGSIPGGSG